jgi:hypothetical protein
MVARANELLTEHRAAWTAGFSGMHARVELRRGFPVRVATGAKGAMLDKAIDRPDWVTVEELSINGADADLPRLLARMPLLRFLISNRESLARLVASGRVFPSIRTIAATSWLPADRVAFPNLAVVAGRWLTYHETAALESAQRAVAALDLDAIVHYCLMHVPQQIVEVVGSRGNGPRETRCALPMDTTELAFQGWYVQTWRDRDDAVVGFSGTRLLDAGNGRYLVEPLAQAGIKRVALALPHAGGGVETLARDFERRGLAIARGAPIDILAPATVRG